MIASPRTSFEFVLPRPSLITAPLCSDLYPRMGPILRHLTFATVLEVLFSTVDVLKLAQATLQFMCDHVRPILESPQLHLILFKFLLKELLRVHAGLKLILSAIGALLGTLVATLCWALFLLITGGHWGHRLTLNRLCIYLVFFLPIAPAPILILLGFAEDVFSPTAYCTAIHLAVYTCAIQLALVYPTATINRDSVPELPEEEIVMLHMASNTLAMLVLNLRNGCGFSLTLKFLEHGGVSTELESEDKAEADANSPWTPETSLPSHHPCTS